LIIPEDFKKEKPMSLSKFKILIFFIICVFSLASCSGGGGSSNDTGTVSMSLMDAPGIYDAVNITILRVEAHKADSSETEEDGSWHTIGTPNKTYNLIELVNGVMESLGVEDLPAGKYTQVRLILSDKVPPNSGKNILGNPHPYANYAIDNSVEIPIKIPSGFNTGIKLVHHFVVEPNSFTELILDFDAMRSIVETGNGKLILKPTIRIIEAVNYAVSGLVTDEATDEGLGGVRVSAQTYDSGNEEIIETAATYTDSVDLIGYYRLPVKPNNSYNIVAFSKDYTPECEHLNTDTEPDYSIDFFLSESGNNEILLNISLAGDEPDPFPDVSVKFIYLNADCGLEAESGDIQVESVVAVYNTNNGVYEYNEIILPYGEYKLIASAEGYMEFESTTFTVTDSSPTGPIEIELQQEAP
jgi:hypothetical protein